MKTTKILSAISLVLIFAANSLFANLIKDPGTQVQQKLITYVVKINIPANFPGAGHYLVAITDENGRKVSPAQPFHPGVWAYTFTEAGTFRGIRVAVMVPYPANTTNWNIPPCKMKGSFVGGQTYLFELTPTTNETVSGTGL